MPCREYVSGTIENRMHNAAMALFEAGFHTSQRLSGLFLYDRGNRTEQLADGAGRLCVGSEHKCYAILEMHLL